MLGKDRRQGVLSNAGDIRRALHAWLETEDTALLSANGALAPADVVGAGLAFSARVVAQEAFLLLAGGADHRVRVLTRVAPLCALLVSSIKHAEWAISRAEEPANRVVALRAHWVPQETVLLTVLALPLRAPAAAERLWLLAEGTVRFKTWWAQAPALFGDAFVASTALRIAKIVRFLETWAALSDHLANVPVAGLDPTSGVAVLGRDRNRVLGHVLVDVVQRGGSRLLWGRRERRALWGLRRTGHRSRRRRGALP